MEHEALDGFVVHPVEPDVKVRATRPMPDLPPDLDREVELRWQAARARVTAGGGSSLFNGRVFSADVITPTLITGHMTEFRRAVAQMEDTALFAALGLRPLAVCGVLLCSDGIVVGQRPPSAVYQAGMWQFPPAGSVDAGSLRPGDWLDLRSQLMAELEEELGVPTSAISGMEPLCVAEHPGNHVLDLGIALTTSLDANEIRSAHRKRGNNEYGPLRVIALDRLATFAEDAGSRLVPSAGIYLSQMGYLERISSSQTALPDE